jgi:maleylacetoacetate isomerase
VVTHAVAASAGQITTEAWMQRFIGPGLAAVEAMLDGGDYCAGGRLSLADLCLVPQVYNADRWGVELSAMPKVRRAVAHLRTLPAFIAAQPEKVPH